MCIRDRDYAAGCAYLNEEELHLTPIEYKLLCLLSKNVGKVLTHTFIMQNIWGNSWDNDIASLRVFMATLRKKIEKGPKMCIRDSTQAGGVYSEECDRIVQTHDLLFKFQSVRFLVFRHALHLLCSFT